MSCTASFYCVQTYTFYNRIFIVKYTVWKKVGEFPCGKCFIKINELFFNVLMLFFAQFRFLFIRMREMPKPSQMRRKSKKLNFHCMKIPRN